MKAYSYERCLERSYQVSWRIDDVLADREFDPSWEWLPHALSAAGELDFMSEGERRMLTHLEMASYAHLFGYAEEFVAPTVVGLAQDFELDHRIAFDALANFAAEEVKHMNLFRRVRDRINRDLGFDLELLGEQAENARFVLSKSRGAVLLLTACIEWLTQRHYRECFHEDENLDPLTRRIFKFHWLEESQHAQMDHLETVRAFAGMNETEKDAAIDDLIELVGAVDGWLVRQAQFDTANFEKYLDRIFSESERKRIFAALLRAKRHTFLVTGVTHPNFLELFGEVATPTQQERVNEALVAMLPGLAEA